MQVYRKITNTEVAFGRDLREDKFVGTIFALLVRIF